MAQAILDVHVSAQDVADMEQEASDVAWAGRTTDIMYVHADTKTEMQQYFNHLSTTGYCKADGCEFRSSKRSRQINHVEAHHLVYLCDCGYMAAYRDTTAKHTRTKHPHQKNSIMQIDIRSWQAARAIRTELPSSAPAFPIRSKDPNLRCTPGSSPTDLRQTLPRISKVAVKEEPRVPKLIISRPSVTIEGDKRIRQLKERMAAKRENVRALLTVVAKLKTELAEDELLLETADARL